MDNRFLKKLQNFIFQEKLLEQEDKVLIGVSGGPDSIGLALALKKLQAKYDLELLLVHVNYHQRGEDSEKDQKFVEKFSKENKLPLRVVDYPALDGSGRHPVPCGTGRSGNLEEQMRDFRYENFEKIRKDLGFGKIAVAHHLDDQAETFLMNMLRGSGLQGLTGMSAKSGLVIRPFLQFSKKEIEKFLESNNQKFRIDKTNLKSDFTRNKIRLELIPLLEKDFNLNVREGLGKLISNLKDENELGDYLVDQIYSDLVEKNGESLIWNISSLKKLPIGGQKRLFRRIILELKGDLKNITNNNFLEFKKILDSKKNKKQVMNFGEIGLEKSKGCVIFRRI